MPRSPAPFLGLIFAVAAMAIWFAGSRILRMGYDSAAALFTFAAGLWLLSLNIG